MCPKIVIADDHPIFRNAMIHTLMSNLPKMISYEAADLKELDHILTTNNDAELLILDLHMPGINGFEGLAYITQKHQDLPIIMISADEDTSIAPMSMRYGARGFIAKSSKVQQITDAVNEVLAGNTYFPDIDDTVDCSETDQLIDKVSKLTGRQLEVFNLLSRGLLNKQIAYKMNVTEATVKAHLTTIMRKLEVHNRTEVVLIANKISINQYAN